MHPTQLRKLIVLGVLAAVVLFVTVLTQAFAPVVQRGPAGAAHARSTAGPPRWMLARGTEIRA